MHNATNIYNAAKMYNAATTIQRRKSCTTPQKKYNASKINKTEKNIDTLEKEIKALEQQLADPVFYNDKEKSSEAIKTYETQKATLEKEMAMWEQLQEAFEKLSV